MEQWPFSCSHDHRHPRQSTNYCHSRCSGETSDLSAMRRNSPAISRTLYFPSQHRNRSLSLSKLASRSIRLVSMERFPKSRHHSLSGDILEQRRDCRSCSTPHQQLHSMSSLNTPFERETKVSEFLSPSCGQSRWRPNNPLHHYQHSNGSNALNTGRGINVNRTMNGLSPMRLYHCRASGTEAFIQESDNFVPNSTTVTDSPNHVGPFSRISSCISPSMSVMEFESRFFKILNPGSDGQPPARTKLDRLHDAARFLFTRGVGVPPLHVSTGKQGYHGPSLKCIMALRNMMESITLSDLELDDATVLYNYASLKEQRMTDNRRVAAFWNIVNTPMLSIVLFLLPSGCPLEIHGHPGMVVISKLLVGSLKTEVLSPLGPPDSEERESEKCFAEGDPGLMMLPLDEHVLDFGAVPCTQDHGATNQYAQLKMSRRISERSSLRRRMIVGSRISRRPGEEFDAIRLFNGIINSNNGVVSPSRRTTPPEEINTDISISRIREVDECVVKHPSSPNSLDQPTHWESLIPSERWPTSLVCTPCFGNLHRFEASSDYVLIVDVISPSYEIPKSRDCQYFTVVSHSPASHVPDHYYLGSSEPTAVDGYDQVRISVLDDEDAGPDVFLEFRRNLQ